MEIKKYANFKEAIEAITGKDKNYIIVGHRLKSGEKIRLHFHNKANEWVVIDGGKFKVKLGTEERIFDLSRRTIVICFPRKEKHAFWAISPVSYFVFRDREDIIIYCKEQ